MVAVYLGLGANQGDRAANLREALARLGEKVAIEGVSSFYETAPVGYVDQPAFLNAVCRGRTELAPGDLLVFVKSVETGMGRRPSFRNAPRPIDVDILLYDDLVLDSPALSIPHPRLFERAFVLVPLVEIAPDLRHPVGGEPMRDLLQHVDTSGVTLWRGNTQAGQTGEAEA